MNPNTQNASPAEFILKVMVFSAGLAAVIKYLAPYWAIAPTSSHALIAVLTPPIVMAIALLWRARQSSQASHSPSRSPSQD